MSPGPYSKGQPVTINRDDIDEVVAKAVKETLTSMGFQADNPIEAQKDMQFLRAWRSSAESVKRQSITTTIAIVTAGFLGLIWVTFKDVLK